MDTDIVNKSQWIIEPQKPNTQISRAVKNKTYVGIDFGTSTTVVSVIVLGNDDVWHPQTLQIKQYDGKKGYIEDSIVNSVLAWKSNKLLFGQPAYKLKMGLHAGINMFSSFKMGLGLDSGPTYPETKLSRKNGHDIIIETALDATCQFFKLLIENIHIAIQENNFPKNIEYAISVPASFQDSQRKDLIKALKYAGVTIDEACFIDEPNAAFLSYFYERSRNKVKVDDSFLNDLLQETLNILVYDFGAGTCDISILELSITNGNIQSRNLAISRFTALGGDDIDRKIAKEILFKQIEWEKYDKDFIIRDDTRDEIIVPRLMPLAERLKIAMIDFLQKKGYESIYKIDNFFDETISLDKIEDLYNLQKAHATITPRLSVQDFKNIMLDFLDDERIETSELHVCQPIYDAIEKAGIELEDLYGVLFIGGSCKNQFVRTSIMSIMPKNVRQMIPQDLRSHVSQGAAIHSLGYHFLHYEFIKPIVSENINILTIDGSLQPLIKASTPVPSKEFTLQLAISQDKQKTVDIPVCLSSENRLLGVLRFTSDKRQGFRIGESVDIHGSININKMLDIQIFMHNKKVSSAILYPMTTESISSEQKEYLKARKKYLEEILSSGGSKNVSHHTLNEYIDACSQYEMYEEAYNKALRARQVNGGKGYAINISYYASKCNKSTESKKWTKIALEEDRNAISTYNYALECSGEEKISWLQKSLEFESNYYPALIILGETLDNATGKEYLEKAFSILQDDFEANNLSEKECYWFKKVSQLLHKNDLCKKIDAYSKQFDKNETHAYDHDNLLECKNKSKILPTTTLNSLR